MKKIQTITELKEAIRTILLESGVETDEAYRRDGTNWVVQEIGEKLCELETSVKERVKRFEDNKEGIMWAYNRHREVDNIIAELRKLLGEESK